MNNSSIPTDDVFARLQARQLELLGDVHTAADWATARRESLAIADTWRQMIVKALESNPALTPLPTATTVRSAAVQPAAAGSVDGSSPTVSSPASSTSTTTTSSAPTSERHGDSAHGEHGDHGDDGHGVDGHHGPHGRDELPEATRALRTTLTELATLAFGVADDLAGAERWEEAIAIVRSVARAASLVDFDVVAAGHAIEGHYAEVLRERRLAALVATAKEMEFVNVPAGGFMMGLRPAVASSGKGSEDRSPAHLVNLDAYEFGRYPVTIEQFAAFVESTGRKVDEQSVLELDTHPKHPVTHVTWDDAHAFTEWLSEVTGRQVRLPTEAEWERAARGSDSRSYPWGSAAPTLELCNFGRQFGGTTPVGKFSPHGDSAFKAADMAGNVWEWCADWYAADYYAESPKRNPTGPKWGDARVLRGGSWYDEGERLRATFRLKYTPDYSDTDFGFRCVRVQGQAP